MREFVQKPKSQLKLKKWNKYKRTEKRLQQKL